MAKAVILHTIEDVKHCLEHELHKDAKLFSTNVNVVYYLKFHYKIECQSLEVYLTPQENYEIQNAALKLINSLLEQLDQYLSAELNQHSGFTIRYFEPLYTFPAARQLSVYMLLAHCFNRMLEHYEFGTVMVYDWRFELGEGLMETFLSKLFPKTEFLSIRYGSSVKNENTIIRNIEIQAISELLSYYDDSEFRSKVVKQRSLDNKSILVYEPFERLSFLVQEYHHSVCLYNNLLSISHTVDYELEADVLPAETDLTIFKSLQDETKILLSAIYNDIGIDFCRNIFRYLQIVCSYKRLHEEVPIRHAFWEIPPTYGAGALLVEYLLTNQVTRVIGVQAKSAFLGGQVLDTRISVYALNRCHSYFTQGLSSLHLQALYPCEAINTDIIPLSGKSTLSSGNQENRETVELAIYLKHTSSILLTGLLPAHIKNQESILNLLGRILNQRIHVVTGFSPTFENCAMISVLKQMNNIMLVQDAGLDNYLTKYNPKVILMDAPTHFLEDMLPEDTVIIIMKDPMTILNSTVLEKLSKRAYYAENINKVEEILHKHFEKKLENRRDSAYMLEFSRRVDFREEILHYID
ncbi:MAG: hypothetical protein E6X17_01120 [Sporomusaceae bacterium]|nr:hypothetical protein [Sporomusaceae bacterium]